MAKYEEVWFATLEIRKQYFSEHFFKFNINEIQILKRQIQRKDCLKNILVQFYNNWSCPRAYRFRIAVAGYFFFLSEFCNPALRFSLTIDKVVWNVSQYEKKTNEFYHSVLKNDGCGSPKWFEIMINWAKNIFLPQWRNVSINCHTIYGVALIVCGSLFVRFLSSTIGWRVKSQNASVEYGRTDVSARLPCFSSFSFLARWSLSIWDGGIHSPT